MAHLRVTALALCWGCSAPAIAEPPPPVATTAEPPRPAPVEIDPFGPGEPARVLSKRLQLSLLLPDRPGWVMAPQKGSFLVLDHAASGSQLMASLWLDDEMMSHERCEARARLLRALPARGRILTSEVMDRPAGFSTRVDIGFDAGSAAGGPIGGHLLAFGAAGRRCFALIFTTTAAGAGAERLVGDRLASIHSLTVEGLRLDSALDIR